MRDGDERSELLFSYVDLEARVGAQHPLRTIRGLVYVALSALSLNYSAMYRAWAGLRSRRKSLCATCFCRLLIFH